MFVTAALILECCRRHRRAEIGARDFRTEHDCTRECGPTKCFRDCSHVASLCLCRHRPGAARHPGVSWVRCQVPPPTLRLACTVTACCTSDPEPVFWLSTSTPAADCAVPSMFADMSNVPASTMMLPPAPPSPPAAPVPAPPVPLPAVAVPPVPSPPA